MGINIEAIDVLPMPARLRVRLECDIVEDMFCRGFEDFESEQGFVGCHSMAMAAGWLERQDGERKWLCPRCSGK